MYIPLWLIIILILCTKTGREALSGVFTFAGLLLALAIPIGLIGGGLYLGYLLISMLHKNFFVASVIVLMCIGGIYVVSAVVALCYYKLTKKEIPDWVNSFFENKQSKEYKERESQKELKREEIQTELGKWIYARNYSLKKGSFLYGASHIMVFVFSGTLILSSLFAIPTLIFVFKIPEKATAEIITAIILGFVVMVGSGFGIYAIKKYLKVPVATEEKPEDNIDQSA